ncbi:Uncharacterised protein [Moraxella ovis]|nr:Uncharacterised protein [Moraxella ovis]STZ06899.1 Uncharacterised protein [Moraxella ovis]
MSMIECINYFIYQPSKEHPWVKNFDVVFSGQNIDTDDRTKFWKCMMSDTTLIKKPKVVEIGCTYQSDNVLISMGGKKFTSVLLQKNYLSFKIKIFLLI